MWIIEYLPEWIVHLIFGIGLAATILGFALSFIPIIKQYLLPIRIIGILVLVLGVYLEGGLADHKEWLIKTAELKTKLADAEAKAAKENIKIVEKVVVKTQVVKQRGQDIIKYVDREVIKYDTKFAPGGICEIPKEFIKAHNDAAEAPKK